MTISTHAFYHVTGVAPNILHRLSHLILPTQLPSREALFFFLIYFTAAQAEKNSLKVLALTSATF